LLESITGIRYFTILNAIVDSFDPIKIRPFDHGEVLVNKKKLLFELSCSLIYSIMINILKIFLFEFIYQKMRPEHHYHQLLYSFMVVDSFLEVFVSLLLFSFKGYLFIYIDSHDTMNYHMSKYTGAKVIAVK